MFAAPTQQMMLSAGLMFLLAAGLTLSPGVADAAPSSVKKRTTLQFESRLRDEDGKPVSGIFAMTFALHKPKTKGTFWREFHWVAVDNGHYGLQLGQSKRLPKGFDPKTAIMEVGIRGVGVVLTEALSGSESASGGDGAPQPKRIVQYAEKTGFAYDAEHAATTARIGVYNAKELTETIDKLKKKKGKFKVGRNHIYLTSAGGVGGTKFEQICPRNMIMVGLRGGAGLYMDNIQVVCAPLE